jgi:outer membrane biosynthesis protein TonB
MSEIEQELRKAWKMRKKEEDFDSRQDYLVALIRGFDIACSKDDDLFDTISQEAADWFNAATEARNKKNEIEEFPDLEAEVAEEAEDEPEDEAEVEEADDTEEADDEPADEPEEAAESDEELSASEEAEAESENEEAEAQAAKKAKSKKPAGGGKVAKPAAKQPKKKREPSSYANITGAKDKFGIIIGTKTAKAVELYEKGATSKDIKEATGGKFYNVLTKLTSEGHKLEKLPGGVFRLTHKDDVVKPSRKGK